MNSIRQINHLNALELQKCVPPSASWHTDYRDTAYIHIGGLSFSLSEGDVLSIFSQFGEPVHINLVRDKETGKSRGFAFLKYADQRSCDLAVDNLSGSEVLGRVLSVDHARYKRKEGEREGVGEGDEGEGGDSGQGEGEGSSGEEKVEERRPLIKEEVELARLLREHDDDDPMKEYLVREKKAEVEEALKAVVKTKGREKDDGRRHRHSHRHRSREESDDGERRDAKSRRRRERSEDDDRRHRSRRDRSASPDQTGAGKDRSHRRSKYDDDDDYERRRRRHRDSRRSRSRDR